MSMAKKIRMMLIEREMTIKELSQKLGYQSNGFSNKLERDNFREKELREIAELLNYDFDGVFTDRDSGKQI